MASPLRAKILAVKDIRTERVHVDAWNEDIEVRGLTGAQRAKAIERATMTTTNDDGEIIGSRRDDSMLSALLIIEASYDLDGQRIFDDEDIAAVLGKSAGALDQVATVAMKLNGMTKAEAKNIAKNSDATDGAAGASV